MYRFMQKQGKGGEKILIVRREKGGVLKEIKNYAKEEEWFLY